MNVRNITKYLYSLELYSKILLNLLINKNSDIKQVTKYVDFKI